MSSAAVYPHLVIGPDGEVFVSGSRYKVSHLAGEHYFHGWTAEELLRQHPDLRPEEVYAALTYFYDHYEELLAKLRHAAHSQKERPVASTLTREELLRRQNAAPHD